MVLGEEESVLFREVSLFLIEGFHCNLSSPQQWQRTHLAIEQSAMGSNSTRGIFFSTEGLVVFCYMYFLRVLCTCI